MLDVSKHFGISSPEAEFNVPPETSPAEYVHAVLAILRRQLWIIVITVAATACNAALYVMIAAPTYKATATVGIDTAKFQLFQPLGERSIESSAAVESQLEVLRSEKLALQVIKDLHLTDKIPPARSSWFGSSAAPSEFEYTRGLLGVIQKHLTVKRLGIAWIIEISYESADPDRAAQFANAFADAYITDQLEAKYQTTRQASTWLEGRVKEVREQTLAAQRAVVEFKARNNIVDTGKGLMSDQQLAELNSQLATARGQTSEAKARLDRVNAVSQSAFAAGNTNGLVTDILISETIGKLRSQLTDLSNRESEWSAKFGQNHLLVVNLRTQMGQIRTAIFDELRRMGEASRSDYDLALRREKNLETQVAQAISQSETSNRAQVSLKELESNATATKELYDNLVKRYMESVEQQSFRVTEARVISQAVRPLDRETKPTLKALAMIFAAGMSIGFGVAALRELTDRTFRTVGQIERRVRMNCITLVPRWQAGNTEHQTTENVVSSNPRTMVMTESPAWAVINSPFSDYAEAMRSLKLAVDLNRKVESTKVIGVTSSLPKEGKSTIAASLALTIGRANAKVILLDFDLRNPTLSRMLAPKANIGLFEVLSGTTPLADAIWTDKTTGLPFLPAVVKSHFIQSNEIMSAYATKSLLDRLREHYDYVVVDLPPLAPVVDTRATTHLIDSYLFIVEWGNTKVDVVEHALGRAPGVREQVLGVVLNKVDMKELNKYDAENATYYCNKDYSQYGYTS